MYLEPRDLEKQSISDDCLMTKFCFIFHFCMVSFFLYIMSFQYFYTDGKSLHVKKMNIIQCPQKQFVHM